MCRRLSLHRNSGGSGVAGTRWNCDVEGECAALTIRTISRNRSAIAVVLTGRTHPCADVYEKKTGCREPHTLPPHLREAFIRLRRTNASRRWKDSLRHTPSCVAARLRGEAAILRCGSLTGGGCHPALRLAWGGGSHPALRLAWGSGRGCSPPCPVGGTGLRLGEAALAIHGISGWVRFLDDFLK